MPVLLNPYIQFRDSARQAMEFYQSVFGGELTMSTFGESGMDSSAPADGIMHAMLVAENLALMASDTPPGMEYEEGAQISISLSGDDDDTLRGYWEKLSTSGQTLVPLEVAPWGDAFGMSIDGNGVKWMVNIAGQPAD